MSCHSCVCSQDALPSPPPRVCVFILSSWWFGGAAERTSRPGCSAGPARTRFLLAACSLCPLNRQHFEPDPSQTPSFCFILSGPTRQHILPLHSHRKEPVSKNSSWNQPAEPDKAHPKVTPDFTIRDETQSEVKGHSGRPRLPGGNNNANSNSQPAAWLVPQGKRKSPTRFRIFVKYILVQKLICKSGLCSHEVSPTHSRRPNRSVTHSARHGPHGPSPRHARRNQDSDDGRTVSTTASGGGSVASGSLQPTCRHPR